MTASIDELITFHTRRGTLSDHAPLRQIAEARAGALEAMQATLDAEAAAVEARLEAARVRDWPLRGAFGSPDDWCVWSLLGRFPMLDTFEHGGAQYQFSKRDDLHLFFIPAAFGDALPTRDAPGQGWQYCGAREILRLGELGGLEALRLITSIPLGIAIYRRLASGSARTAVAAAAAMQNHLIQLGRDPTQRAYAHASFARAWAAQDAGADRILTLLANEAGGGFEPMPEDSDDRSRRLSDEQLRAANTPARVAARLIPLEGNAKQLDRIEAGLAELKADAKAAP